MSVEILFLVTMTVRESKEIILIRGLPGSGKTTLCNQIHCDKVIHVDDLEDDSIKSIAIKIINLLKSNNIIAIDGVFPSFKDIVYLFTCITEAYLDDMLTLRIIATNNEWSNSPYKCWTKTIERCGDNSRGIFISPLAILKLKDLWEDTDVKVLRYDPNNRKIEGSNSVF